MNILITGITGFIGNNLSLNLKIKGINIFGIVRKETDTTFLSDNNIDFFIYDNNNELLELYLIKNKINGIIHLATLYLVSNNLTDIDNIINSNITFGTKLLEISSNIGIKWFLNTSSFIQNFENNAYSPQNLYAATKQAFEDIGRYYSESGKINFISLSLVNTYGKGDKRKKIFNIWNENSKSLNKLNSTSGDQYIDILYIDDIIDAYVLLLKLIIEKGLQINGNKYIVSSGNIIKLKDLSEIFENTSGKKLNINWGGIHHREREIMYPYNIGKKIPGWKPKITLYQGIKKFLDI